jgi:flavin reductase (DIM6/NTAB) family NADH-FMN oxidoreductase RutF/flavodoxin
MIAYASVYGNTENAAEILACKLRDKGIKTVMYDVSVSAASEIIAAAFRWSHLVFASTTYNAGIFVSMEDVINDLVAHNIQNRTVAVIENGTWAATSGSLIREKLGKCKNINLLDQTLSIKSSLKISQLSEIDVMVQAITSNFSRPAVQEAPSAETKEGKNASIDNAAMLKLSYGLFVLNARDGEKDNGCIINTAAQITSSPLKISITVNKTNLTHTMIAKTGEFTISVLDNSVPFKIFEQFGFHSGNNTDKFAECTYDKRAANGIRFIPEHTNSIISAKVLDSYDYGSHTMFIADVTEAFLLSDIPSVTYQYYFDNIKPKPQTPKENKKGYSCKICGYIYEGSSLPADFVCPLCKHGAQDFEAV